eukprot:TRINITY_DN517_c0_g1_i2.p1 TRINITY_DN517_c0_g1~~TRINITY_DN517_c0_g1_i2.p1  ORF type:complete len:203 (+),score=42.74 TRINITY_DN517_c0_g1_i2:669-1277(+)
MLSQARWGLVAASIGSIVVFAGGEYNDDGLQASGVVDIYNSSENKWYQHTLSVPRTNLVAVSAGTKILFAGGRTWNDSKQDGVIVDTIDVYEIYTKKWTVEKLPSPREFLAAASAKGGEYVIFAGGNGPSGDGQGKHDKDKVGPSERVDIFNLGEKEWSKWKMSQPRSMLSGVSLNNVFYFGFGMTKHRSLSQTIDVFSCKP